MAAAQLAKREKRTGKALLGVENNSLRGVRQIVRRATDVVAAERVRVGGSPAATVRRQAPSTQASLATELLESKRTARRAGRLLLEEELGASFPLVIEAAELDAAASFVAAASLTAAWGNASLSAIAADAVLSKIPGIVDSNVERTVATEVARAFNHERNEILVDFGLEGLDGGRDDERHVRSPGMFKVWSAHLDGKTCDRCFAVDGETIELHKSFKAPGPPLHPFCRCTIEHVIVPKPERLEDIAIDYELFKEELRDVIREHRAIGGRHAQSFLSDSLGERRSAEVLARRFRDEAYATAGPTSGRFTFISPAGGGGIGGGGGGPPRGGGGGEGGGGEEHPAHRRLGIPQQITPTRDRAKESRAHHADGREVRRELKRGKPVFFFEAGANLDEVEALVWQHGEPQKALRGHDRISLVLDKPIGIRKQHGEPDRPLDVVEIKGKIVDDRWVYHLVPREKPAK